MLDPFRPLAARLAPARRGRWQVAARAEPSVWRRLSPPQLLAVTIVGMIALGTLGLQLLPGIYTGAGLSWLDAAYTMTSAVCVTGLTVVDTATTFTPFGQAWILLFIQLGGLGIISFTSWALALLGQRMSLRQEALSASAFTGVAPHVDERQLVRDVVRFTFLIEGVGAVLLTLFFWQRFPLGEALWYGVFHSISAFCNAGFSTFSDSLMSFKHDAPLLLVVSALVIAGSLGFITIEELTLWTKAARTRRRFRLSLHSRLVLAVTAGLLVAGTLAGRAIEHNVTMQHLGSADLWTNAFFFSAMRTAGFSTINYAEASAAALFVTILLMFIGGSPGSVAGGLRTTTFGVLLLMAWAGFRGRTAVSAWSRTVPDGTIRRAITQFLLCITLATLGILGFTLLEAVDSAHDAEVHFLGYMFEAVSAFGTVGLSMNLTPTLSDGSRVLSILLMLAGRLGPMAFALALSRPARHGIARYAHEDVAVN